MSQSLARVVWYVVFNTKNRVPFLKDPELRVRLHAYMAGVLQDIGCEPLWPTTLKRLEQGERLIELRA